MTAEPARGSTHHEPPPADPADLATFPKAVVHGTWFRAHVLRSTTGDRGCWWFSSAGVPADGSGRFDLPEPRGTCYLASTEDGAARERVGPQLRRRAGSQSVLDSVLADASTGRPVVVSRVDLERPTTANMASKRAGRWVDRSLGSGTGIYAVSQAWAAAFDAAGFDGIRYQPRFTLGAVRAVALFGRAGAPTPARSVVSRRELREVLEQHGVRIVTAPATAPPTLPATAPPVPL